MKLLEELFHDYPSVPVGRHLEVALVDYSPLSAFSEKEICWAIEKYQTELSLDIQNIAPDDFVYKIQKDAEHLFDNQILEDDNYETD